MEDKGKYNKVIIDLGTGDGRFVYKNAVENPENLYIGIDPAEKQMEIYQKRVNRKRLGNALFLTGSIESLPKLEYKADELNIILPWGTLLMRIIKPEKKIILKLAEMMKPESVLNIVLGYSKDLEPAETDRLKIPQINEAYIKNEITQKFNKWGGLQLEKVVRIDNENLKKLETTWSKKLSFGKNRDIFKIEFRKSN